ncbi:3-ketoacyl-reductase-like protein [Phyllosticta citribraziliensis]|uniref:3-ketoacyl-reductase-like protein n=1 Tax=Phyllosticta citribraziliensis TaxID=989973 RepID=A0ABR1LDF4_9PEZI
MGRLDGKVAIVTGGSSGFGAAISLAFAAEGAHVLICDINEASGRAIASTNPSNLTFQPLDVTSAAQWDAAMAAAVAAHGRVDILVNNAGTSYAHKPTLQVTEDEFDRVFAVNVKSVFLGSNAFARAVVAADQSTSPTTTATSNSNFSIINISSTGSQRPRPELVWYNASKGAVSNATKGLAAEFGPAGIRVNAVLPLITATGLFETFVGPDSEGARAKLAQGIPLGRIGRVDDVVGACVWLASAEAGFVTGVNLPVDGGRCI